MKTKEIAMKMVNVLILCMGCLFSNTVLAKELVPEDMPLKGPKLNLPDGIAIDKANEITNYLTTKVRFLDGHTALSYVRCDYWGSYESAHTFVAMLQEHSGMEVAAKYEAMKGNEVMFVTEQHGNAKVLITFNKSLIPANELLRAQEAAKLKRSLAEELIVALKMPERLKQDFEKMRASSERALRDADPARRRNQEEGLQLFAIAYQWASVKEEFIETVANSYTQEELATLVKFYSSSAGKRMGQLEPATLQALYKGLSNPDAAADSSGFALEPEDFKKAHTFFSTNCGKRFLGNVPKMDQLLVDLPLKALHNR